MTGFPPDAKLAQVVRSLLTALPEDHATLLQADRFAEARDALVRLADPAWLQAAVGATTPGEAAALADRLLQRWSRLGPVRLEPAAAIDGPAEIWIGDAAPDTAYRAVVSGLEPDWSVLWSGDAAVLPDGHSARLTVDDANESARLAVRVIGRSEQGRCIVTAERTVKLRRLRVRLDPTRRVLWLMDAADHPLARQEARIGETAYTTSEAGSIDLAAPLPPGTVVSLGSAVVQCP
ncbi:MAG: hypothetical protein JSS43_31460 [Proteobacteria bacterium]|nr:hypothetical protein [Pseudomonadota bacterium]